MSDIGKNASMEQHKASQEGLGIGKLVTGEQHRDAIHVAIVPMVAGEQIFPGQHIRLAGGHAFAAAAQQPDTIGIADPFLNFAPVMPEQSFWLFLYPGSITRLRHVWTHPGLDNEANVAAPSKSLSEVWMRAWAKEHMSTDYYGDGERLSDDAAYENAVNAGRNMSVGPYESARDSIGDEWWTHWEIITGSKGERGEYFSCSC